MIIEIMRKLFFERDVSAKRIVITTVRDNVAGMRVIIPLHPLHLQTPLCHALLLSLSLELCYASVFYFSSSLLAHCPTFILFSIHNSPSYFLSCFHVFLLIEIPILFQSTLRRNPLLSIVSRYFSVFLLDSFPLKANLNSSKLPMNIFSEG